MDISNGLFPWPHSILAEVCAGVPGLKKHAMRAAVAGEGSPVAILDRNEPAFHCVPARAFEVLMERLADTELNVLADAGDGSRACASTSM